MMLSVGLQVPHTLFLKLHLELLSLIALKLNMNLDTTETFALGADSFVPTQTQKLLHLSL